MTCDRRSKGPAKAARLAAVLGLLNAFAMTSALAFSEAPSLQERVKKGELPPLEKRLPKSPQVIKPLNETGTYGGTWRNVLIGGSALGEMFRFQGYESLARWNHDWTGVVPGIAEDIKVNATATEYTFKLREGTRWSDGTPFTADDIVFWYEDIFSNPTLTPNPASWMTANGKPLVVKKIDDYTFTVTFDAPNGLFLQWLASGPASWNLPTNFPRHYLSKFLPKYNPNADAEAKAKGYAGWTAQMMDRGAVNPHNAIFKDSGRPVLFPWVVTVGAGESTTQIVAERNPYYWKVDDKGNQLPYIDRISSDLVGDVQVGLLKTLNGEVDFIDYLIATPANKAVLAEGSKKGGYDFFTTKTTLTNVAVIQLNLNHPDPGRRDLFRNKNFRIAISHAINREEIVDVVFYGAAEPWQAAPREGAFYNQQLAKQYLDFDLKKANALLDSIGLTQRDSAGFRLGPDKKRLTLSFEVDAAAKTISDSIELVNRSLAQVGIEGILRASDRALWEQRVRQGDNFDVAVHSFGGGDGLAVVFDPRYYFPHSQNSMFAKKWASWFQNPTAPSAEEPPAAARKQMDLYKELSATADPAKQSSLMHEILKIAADEFYVIGIAVQGDGYGVVTNRLKNTPKSMPNSYVFPHPGPFSPEQFYIGRN